MSAPHQNPISYIVRYFDSNIVVGINLAYPEIFVGNFTVNLRWAN